MVLPENLRPGVDVIHGHESPEHVGEVVVHAQLLAEVVEGGDEGGGLGHGEQDVQLEQDRLLLAPGVAAVVAGALDATPGKKSFSYCIYLIYWSLPKRLH